MVFSSVSFMLAHLSNLLSSSFSTFNPADYTANSGARQETWEGDGNEHSEGTSKKNNMSHFDAVEWLNCELKIISFV